MRYIQKPLYNDAVPASLRLPLSSNFNDGKIPKKTITTNSKRLEAISRGSYDTQYDSLYKSSDIKIALEALYFRKCAYCEQYVEQYHIEHYRPKQIYYWLAFSWDNLICVCPFCNQYKGTNFETKHLKFKILADFTIPSDIHQLGVQYDKLEEPMMVNPEAVNPVGLIEFQKDGVAHSTDPRLNYTIQTCRISRVELNDARKKILDDLRKDLRMCRGYLNPQARTTAIKTVIQTFARRAVDHKETFTAFRIYLLKHWIAEEVKAAIAV
jgi:uncharacterized protein (TIGR02646 family)